MDNKKERKSQVKDGALTEAELHKVAGGVNRPFDPNNPNDLPFLPPPVLPLNGGTLTGKK